MDIFYVNKIDDDFIKWKPMRCSNFIDADSQLYIRTVQPSRIFIMPEVSSCPRCAWGHRGTLAQQYTAPGDQARYHLMIEAAAPRVYI